ncbi:Permease [Limosilactobacillus gastricus PS3]|uniref:Permease n=1 Tax=Limosilactobacillus gastricus PS3 TaxID=1144300 RepID=H4GK34_9LACO|nr:AI-2E family transporter [Limosilactobacillus gastricus]EHS85850.1 Permease [Limosilactobacillus gastricus PS3]
MESSWQRFINNTILRRTVVLVAIIFVLWYVRAVMTEILLTFIFTYLIVHWLRLVQRWLPKLPTAITAVVTYAIIIFLAYVGVTKYMPILINQIVRMVDYVINFSQSNDMTWFTKYITHYVSMSTITTQVRHWVTIGISTLTSVGTFSFSFVMAVILSFFYSIELKQMNGFSRSFLDSNVAGWFFRDLYYFGQKFVNTFGVVLEAQFFIAITNTVITTVCLIVMQMPQIVALSVMVFAFSLVPVAGVIISLIPLCMVGYSTGGIKYIIYILIMIAVIHVIEAYVLNPKFMASRTQLPIFYTFVVLLVGEHFFGVWGLIVGVPIFTFFLDILGVKSFTKSKTNKINLQKL